MKPLEYYNLHWEVARRVPIETLDEWLQFLNNCIDKGEEVPHDLFNVILSAWFILGSAYALPFDLCRLLPALSLQKTCLNFLKWIVCGFFVASKGGFSLRGGLRPPLSVHCALLKNPANWLYKLVCGFFLFELLQFVHNSIVCFLYFHY